MATGTDYDTRRVTEDTEPGTEFVEQLVARRNDAASGSVDVEEPEATQLPDASYLDAGFGDELGPAVVPRQDDEFTCSRCFLIVPRRRYARTLRSRPICRDCS